MAIELTTATTQQLSGIRQSLGAPLITDIFPNGRFVSFNGEPPKIDGSRFGSIMNCKNCFNFRTLSPNGTRAGWLIDTVLNAQDLTNLENIGTAAAVSLAYHELSETALNQFFTDLPATNKTATINVAGNPGAATCDPTIATAKGYTVVTS